MFCWHSQPYTTRPASTYYDRKRRRKRQNAPLICLARYRCDVLDAMLNNGELYRTSSSQPLHTNYMHTPITRVSWPNPASLREQAISGPSRTTRRLIENHRELGCGEHQVPVEVRSLGPTRRGARGSGSRASDARRHGCRPNARLAAGRVPSPQTGFRSA